MSLRSSSWRNTAPAQGYRRIECRGEDSNLCFRGERDLLVGAPLQQLSLLAGVE